MTKKIARVEFAQFTLTDDNALDDPFLQLGNWWQEAIDAQVNLIDAVHLSTVDHHHQPDGRIVLLKHFDHQGLIFFTNYDSNKGKQLIEHPFAALTIFWPSIERQIRIRGHVTKIDRGDSASYFSSRPRGAQIGAWASPQSEVINNRDVLEKNFAHYDMQFSDRDVPCPPNWGGFRVHPNFFEFWQGRTNRLHDRISYSLVDDQWRKQRLAP